MGHKGRPGMHSEFEGKSLKRSIFKAKKEIGGLHQDRY
jgi:hypothetical protein